ncbi:MaoC family dehydratase, partial [Vibrio sp. 10N.222.46.A1]
TLTKVTPIKKGLEIEREIRVEIEGITSLLELFYK